MARILHDEEERLRRINLVGNYFVNNCGVSIRDASKYFKNMKIEMSNCTISNYLKLYKELHSEDRSIIDGKIKQNCPNTIMDEEVKKRVLYVAKVYVYTDKTIEEIANSINESVWIVLRDLTTRLNQIDPKLYEKYKEKAAKNSINNLNNISIR